MVNTAGTSYRLAAARLMFWFMNKTNEPSATVAGPFLVSNRDREHTVHGQRGDCRTADSGHTGDLSDEVVAPYVDPGMEQLCRIAGCRIDGGGTCSFSQRWEDTAMYAACR